MHGRPGKVLYGQRAAEAAPVTPADRSGRHRRVVAPTAQTSGKFALAACPLDESVAGLRRRSSASGLPVVVALDVRFNQKCARGKPVPAVRPHSGWRANPALVRLSVR